MKTKTIAPAECTPMRMELKELFRPRDFPFLESSLLLSPLGFRSPYPPRQVNSLYFDSEDFRTLELSLSGVSLRQKNRLRWYGEVEDALNPTLEFKRKKAHLSWKTLRRTDLRINPNAVDWSAAFLDPAGVDALSSLRRALPVNQHRPVTLVSYHRRYYESADGRVRVTMDQDLSFRDQASTGGPNFRYERLHSDKLVLEVKLAEEDSACLAQLSRTLPFVPRRFSKYCESLLGHLPRWY